MTEEDRPGVLEVDLRQAAPGGSQLEIRGDGQLLASIEVPREGWQGEVELPPVTGQLVLELISSVFVPAETIPSSRDRRELGVFVQSLRLR